MSTSPVPSTATIHDVARHAGVSIATVSRYINDSGYVSEGNRQRIGRAVAELDFTPSHSARSLNTRASNIIGLVVPSIAHPFWAEVARGVQDVGAAAGYVVSICSTDGIAEREMASLRTLRAHRVDVLIVNWYGATESARYLQRLASADTVVAMVGRPLVHPQIDTITSDNRGAARAAMLHLLGLGHRHIAFLGGPPDLLDDRYAVYVELLQQWGLPVASALVEVTDLTLEGGSRAMHRLLALHQRPTAVLCIDDLVALGAHQAAHQAGCRVPDDLSIVGFDDDVYARLVTPPLTTVAKHTFQIGRLAAERALARLRARQAITGEPPPPGAVICLPCDLIIRGSTGPPRAR
jgi:LacI family transcriptional regulator